jgi:hemin uptake protein HemP
MNETVKVQVEQQVQFESKHENAHVEQDISVQQIRKINTEDLFGSANTVLIEHLGEHYQLTITKQKKLLLTKVIQAF